MGRGRRKFRGGQVLSTWLMLVCASSVEVFILLKNENKGRHIDLEDVNEEEAYGEETEDSGHVVSGEISTVVSMVASIVVSTVVSMRI